MVKQEKSTSKNKKPNDNNPQSHRFGVVSWEGLEEWVADKFQGKCEQELWGHKGKPEPCSHIQWEASEDVTAGELEWLIVFPQLPGSFGKD